MTTHQIAARLIELCHAQQFSEARKTLYAADAISIEADNKAISGLAALDEKEKAWHGSIEQIHQIAISEPLVNGQFFSIAFTWDLTYKGQERGGWKEIGVFEVKDGKVVLEKFYY
jgi:hypothetical protein